MNTVTRSSARHTGAGSDPGPRDLFGTVVLLVLSGLLLLVASGLARPLLDRDPGARPGELGVPGGVVVVRDVVPDRHSMNPGMPAGMMPDPLPDGFQRVAVSVSLLADSAEGLAYDAADFRVRARGMAPAGPQREALGSGVVPEGSQVDGVLVFEVPETANRFRIGTTGTPATLPVSLDAPGDDRQHHGPVPAPGDHPHPPGTDEEHDH